MAVTKIRRLLLASPVPQYQVAAACNIDPSTLTQYSLGNKNPRPQACRDLADYFGVEIEDILGWENDDHEVSR